MNPTDAAALAALETQFRQLSRVLDKLLGVRARLVPARATFWRGRAREMYNRSVRDLDADIGSAIELIRTAHRATRMAISEVEARG